MGIVWGCGGWRGVGVLVTLPTLPRAVRWCRAGWVVSFLENTGMDGVFGKRRAWKVGVAMAVGVGAVVVASIGERAPAARRERAKAPEAPKAHVEATDPIQAGKYLIMIGGCN